MRALLVCLLLAASAAPASAQGVVGGSVTGVPQSPPRDPQKKPLTGTGSIAGRITAADTGAPMRRAVVNLHGLQRARATLTDHEGRYQFTALPAASYTIQVNPGTHRAGYQASSFGAPAASFGLGRPKPIELADGQRIDNIDVALHRTGVITGQVTDAYGEPAARVQVGAWRVRGGADPTQAGVAQTDDLGQFRLFNLAPGDYMVMATAPTFRDPDFDGEPTGFAPTYAPGTPVRAEAMRVRVGRGAQVSADVRLVETRVYSISGTVMNSKGEAAGNTSVMLMRLEGSVPGLGAAVSPTGSFTIRNVPPGRYEVIGRSAPQRPPNTAMPGPDPGQEYASVAIEVDSANLEGVVLVTRPGATVTGEIVFEDAPPEKARVNLSTRPIERRMFVGPPLVEVKADAFTLRNVFTDTVIRGSIGAGPSWGLKAVLLRGKDITDVPTTFTAADSGHLQVVFTSRAPAVEGTVTDETGKPVEEAAIMLFGHDPSTWQTWSSYFRMGPFAKEGKFSVNSLREGRYYAVAVPPELVMGTQPTPEMFESLSKVATAVTLNAGERRVVDLVLVRLQDQNLGPVSQDSKQ